MSVNPPQPTRYQTLDAWRGVACLLVVVSHSTLFLVHTARANPEWYRGNPPNASGIPLGRQGHVDEIAATCLFLVSDDGGFITGQTIHVNGGAQFH